MDFYVAGVKHHKFYGVADKLKEGDSVQLIPELTNKFDKFAVRVQTSSGVMLGYVPATISERVSEKLMAGKNLTAKITSLSLEKEPWYALKVEIKEENKDE